jgi:hypothetical protein
MNSGIRPGASKKTQMMSDDVGAILLALTSGSLCLG